MSEQAEVVMRLLRPFWGRITLLESPVDEATRESGIILPILRPNEELKRGVVMHVDDHWSGSDMVSEQIPQGTAVYYRGGTQIGDVIVVEPSDIIAFEASE